MESTLHSANILSFAARLAPAQAEVSEFKAREQALIFSLTQHLQSSLELNEILNLFFSELCSLISLDGFCYTHSEEDMHFSTPAQGKHKISYALDTDREKLGTLVFTRNVRFQEDDLTTLENVLSCMLYPLQNSLQYQRALKAANTDALTGCGNRAALNKVLHREIDLSKRDEIPLSLIMFDFDHFKSINDAHGHQCGDLVLQRAVMEIQGMVRKTDLLFRYGGEEFVLVLHKTDQGGAAIVAEKIRTRISDMPIQYQGKQLDITISAGVTSLKENDDISSLIKNVDKLLYDAKKQGRNRVVICAELVEG